MPEVKPQLLGCLLGGSHLGRALFGGQMARGHWWTRCTVVLSLTQKGWRKSAPQGVGVALILGACVLAGSPLGAKGLNDGIVVFEYL